MTVTTREWHGPDAPTNESDRPIYGWYCPTCRLVFESDDPIEIEQAYGSHRYSPEHLWIRASARYPDLPRRQVSKTPAMEEA